jgi:hypothetical protein
MSDTGHAGFFARLVSYGTMIFSSAFLIFLVEPLLGRLLLPYFGGAVSVWGASLVFFTTMLFFGYLYAYLVSELSGKSQLAIHSFVLTLAAVSCGTLAFYAEPILLSVESFSLAPALGVMVALFLLAGPAFFLLSTTGPLLQGWYFAEHKEEPYRLYALSNLGSFLGLGLYPFVVEPLMGLTVQRFGWALLVLFCAVALFVRTGRSTRMLSARSASSSTVPVMVLVEWLLLAAIPSAMLVATTARVTQVIAPIPFIWIIPLALYLLSFILAFRGWGRGGLTAALVLLSAFASYTYIEWSYYDFTRQAIANISLFFFGALFCHALLYERRPHGQDAPFFYVWVSLGGAVGTLVIALLAPMVFIDVTEYIYGASALALLAILEFPAMKYIRDEYLRHTKLMKGALVIAVVVVSSGLVREPLGEGVLYQSRNFYGIAQVYESDMARYLYHGTTLHGMQLLGEDSQRVTTYYVPTSGVGRAIISRASTTAATVGVVGLGTGSIAAYCRPGDTFTFYEIDQRIVDVAEEYFTYLANCDGSEVHVGDGRLLLEAEGRRGDAKLFDVLAVDAFSDDSIPVHLLTKEAIELYMSRIAEGGILAVHTSNRYLELSPIVARIALELGLSSMVIIDDAEEDGHGTLSQWVLLTRDARTFEDKIFAEAVGEPVGRSAPLWTDDYANVLSVVDLPAFSQEE